MSNETSKNPIILDTFSSDFTLRSLKPIRVRKIRMKTAAANDIFVLEDRSENKVVWLQTEIAGQPVEIDFADDGFIFDGLQFDADDGQSGLGSGDLVWIYLK